MRVAQVLLCCCLRRPKDARPGDEDGGYAARMEREQAPPAPALAPRSPAPAPADAGTPRGRRMYTHVGTDKPDELPPKLAAALGVPVRTEPRGTYPPPFAPSYDAAAPPPRSLVRLLATLHHLGTLHLLCTYLRMHVADAASPAVCQVSKMSANAARSEDGDLTRKM
jgi:hypothetical protein